MLNKQELCEYLKVNDRTLTKWIKQGLPCYHNGRTYRFDLEEVKQWLRSEWKWNQLMKN